MIAMTMVTHFLMWNAADTLIQFSVSESINVLCLTFSLVMRSIHVSQSGNSFYSGQFKCGDNSINTRNI